MMSTELMTRTESLLKQGTAMFEEAVSRMYDGEWEESIVESFNAARLHLVALVVSHGGDPGSDGLGGLLTWIEETSGKMLPESLLQRSRKLDGIFLLIKSRTARSLGWEDYHDEEQCSNMIHSARSIIKFCRTSINKSNSRARSDVE